MKGPRYGGRASLQYFVISAMPVLRRPFIHREIKSFLKPFRPVPYGVPFLPHAGAVLALPVSVKTEDVSRRRRRSRGGEMLTRWLYRDYTDSMKTAISLPDSLYDEAERTAQTMGIPRSQLFARALEEFLEHHKRENITERLNQVYAGVQGSESRDISAAGLESLRSLTKNDTW